MSTATSSLRWPTCSDVTQDYGIAGLHSSRIVAPIAGGETLLRTTGHADQGAFRILEMADDESIG
jgi:hypothetical protein